MRDIFYNINNLTLKDRRSLIKFAKDNSLDWWVDELDCSKSFARQRIDMPFEEVSKLFKLSSHFVVSNRNGEYGEIAFCTFKDPDYFLWINVDLDILHQITKKFNLHKK
jgi:hypothetical protein